MRVLSALLAVVLAFSVAPAASAVPSVAATPNCSWYGGPEDLMSYGYIRASASSPRLGLVQLCMKSDLWYAQVTMYQAMPAGRWANAYLEIWVNGVHRSTISCSDTSSGAIGPGYRVCATNLYHWSPGLTFRGIGRAYTRDAMGRWVAYASGVTARKG